MTHLLSLAPLPNCLFSYGLTHWWDWCCYNPVILPKVLQSSQIDININRHFIDSSSLEVGRKCTPKVKWNLSENFHTLKPLNSFKGNNSSHLLDLIFMQLMETVTKCWQKHHFTWKFSWIYVFLYPRWLEFPHLACFYRVHTWNIHLDNLIWSWFLCKYMFYIYIYMHLHGNLWVINSSFYFFF